MMGAAAELGSILESDNVMLGVLDMPSAWVLWESDNNPWGATWARMDFVGPPPFAAPVPN
jgi:hypothetical protein